MEKIRLDKYLTEHYPNYSRSKLQKMIKTGLVLVNGKVSGNGYILRSDDNVFVKPDKKIFKGIETENLAIDVVYEDKGCLVINKPPFVIVHPSEHSSLRSGTIVNALMSKFSFKHNFDDLRPGIVHRLDKDTSGLLVIAKNEDSYLQLVDQFKDRLVKKSYLALISGIPRHSEGVIDSPIGRSTRDRKKMDIGNSISAKTAISSYRVINHFNVDNEIVVSLVEVKILTGRTHQIRVHMAAIGHPVVGDVTYGNKKLNGYFQEKFGLKRQFLHAWKLGFRSPSTKKMISLKSNLPNDLAMVMKQLKSF